MIGRSQGHLAATVCVLGLGACSAPTENTDLRPGGPPEVLTVLASDDAAGDGILEAATFCKTGDKKRPGLIPANPDGPAQICPEDLLAGADEVTDTFPVDWYVRIQFDELLNPSVEDLVPITDKNGNPTGQFSGSLASSQPVTITCAGVTIPYDGYYNPSGNSVTWPVGPSLFIAPTDTSTIPAGTECEVTIKPDVVADKDGEHVPDDQLGPYKFKIADLAVASTTPAALEDPTMPPDMPAKIDATSPLVITFNATIDPATLPASAVTMRQVKDCTGTPLDTPATPVPLTKLDPDDKTSIDISDANGPANPTTDDPNNHDAWVHGATYIVTFVTGTVVKDLAGATLSLPDDLTICFQTAE
ncbi:MAG TPA: Ig-like domain-containing protein [Kofleriaceae bacterium]|nr:Ig-like domain-containing protein [Kofleriaceae bacterium]